MQPFNYQQQVVNPFEQAIGSAMQGFKFGAGVREIQEQRQAAMQARARQEELNRKLGELQMKQNPTWEDYESIALFLPEKEAESLRKNFEMRSTSQKESAKKFSGQVAAALLSPNEESRQRGVELLRQRAEAERNAGNTADADAYELHAKIAETGAEGSKSAANEIMILGAATFGKDWAESILKFGQVPSRIVSSAQDKVSAGLVNEVGEPLPGTFVIEPGKAPALMSVEERFRPANAEDRKRLNLDPQKSWQISEKSGKAYQIGTDPAVVFQAPLIGAREKYYDVVGEETGKEDVAQVQAANKSVNDIGKIDTTLNQLYSSEAITGLGAEVFKNVERVKSLLGSKAAQGKVSDTELLDALLGSDVFPQIGALGIGARGLDTPAEREFLRQVMTGTINMDRNTLIRLTELRRDLAQRSVERYNARVQSGELDKYFEAAGRTKSQLQIPDRPRPAASSRTQPAPQRAIPGMRSTDDILRELGVIP